MFSTLLIILPPGSLWLRVVASERVQSMGQIKLFLRFKLIATNFSCKIELLEIELFDDLIVCKQIADA